MEIIGIGRKAVILRFVPRAPSENLWVCCIFPFMACVFYILIAGRTHSNNSSKKARRISTVPTTVNAEEMLELAFNSSFTDNESQRAFFAEIIGLPIEKVLLIRITV